MMYELRESDSPIVSKKPANNGSRQMRFDFLPAELAEKRGLAKGNARKHPKVRTQRRVTLPSYLSRIRRASKNRKVEKFTALFHHVYSEPMLKRAFYTLKRQAAPGIDEMTWKAYQSNLDANLSDLAHRLKTGTYQSQAVKRCYIPKSDGRQHPIGIPVLEDKIVEKSMVIVLNQLYEEQFLNFSHGFRPNRNQHHALDALALSLEKRWINWILDADIQGFFDHLSHE